jgi:small subunit ribosomal protein S4
MSNNASAKHRRCRVVGYCLFGKAKCPSAKRAYPPGSHGKGLQRKPSDYGKQLIEKQKLRDSYGMKEAQFVKFFKIAAQKQGVKTGDALLMLLESRLDNLVYRAGLAKTIFDARQIVNHGHIQVNGKKVNIPSFVVKPSNKITLTEKAKKNNKILESVERGKTRPILPYLKLDTDNLGVTFTGINNIGDIPNRVEISQVVELYSK